MQIKKIRSTRPLSVNMNLLSQKHITSATLISGCRNLLKFALYLRTVDVVLYWTTSSLARVVPWPV